MQSYKLRCDRLSEEHIGTFTTYGLDVFDENEALLRSVPDISLSEEKMSSLVQLCNSLQLSFLHLDDVIADFLASSQ